MGLPAKLSVAPEERLGVSWTWGIEKPIDSSSAV